MKTSWNDTRQIDAHIAGEMHAEDALVFEARLLLEPELADNVLWQQKTHAIIKNYGRRQLLNEIEAVHQKLFTVPAHRSFSQRIRQLFTKP